MTWVNAARRLLWGKNNYLKYTKEQRRERRLTMLLNLIAMDTIIAQEGGESIVSKEEATDWIAKYDSQKPTNHQ